MSIREQFYRHIIVEKRSSTINFLQLNNDLSFKH